jgi:membrane-bound lytic murein transglycosylase A
LSQRTAFLVSSLLAVTVFAWTLPSSGQVRTAPGAAVKAALPKYVPVPFAELPGWQQDDHAAALKAFVASCQIVIAAAKANNKGGTTPTSPELLSACDAALKLDLKRLTPLGAKTFFETHFTPHKVEHNGPAGLLTGYYEPVISGSRKPTAKFSTPIYNRPPDLMNLVEESQRGAKDGTLTHGRKTANGVEPYATRAEIEQGALKGKGLELMYLADPVDAFFMQIQGSGRIKLPDGSMVRVSYDGKNGHPYTSIGRHLIDTGLFPADKMSLKALGDWLKADAERGRRVMWQNKSYVFFRELKGKEAEGALGVLHIPLTTGRSLAVDAGVHAIGTPVYVSAPALTHATKSGGFHRLMVAQDVGSAIKGPERGDIYFGTGDAAGKLAGVTKHPGSFFVLLPGAPAPVTVTADKKSTPVSAPPAPASSRSTPRAEP